MPKVHIIAATGLVSAMPPPDEVPQAAHAGAAPQLLCGVQPVGRGLHPSASRLNLSRV